MTVAMGCLQSTAVRADDLFQLFWRVNCYTTNSTGHIISVGFSEQNYVNQVAQNNGLDPSQLVLVYRPRKRDAAVVRTDGTFIASVIQMSTTVTDIVNPNGTVIVRHALLSDNSHETPLGSFFGLEMPGSSGGVYNSDQLVGTVVYSNPDSNMVYGGRISTGSRVLDTTNAP
jgi:hypothetical protein